MWEGQSGEWEGHALQSIVIGGITLNILHFDVSQVDRCPAAIPDIEGEPLLLLCCRRYLSKYRIVEMMHANLGKSLGFGM